MTEIIEWHKGLPELPLAQGFSSNHGRTTIRSNMEVGEARVRLIDSSAPRTISCTYLLRDSQLQIFEYFYEVFLKGGVKWFRMRNPYGREGYVMGRIIGVPNCSTIETMWNVNLNIEIRDVPILDDGKFVLIHTFGNIENFDRINSELSKFNFEPTFEVMRNI